MRERRLLRMCRSRGGWSRLGGRDRRRLGRAVEVEALAVEAVDRLAGGGVVEGDRLDHLLPGQAANLDPVDGRLEPLGQPGFALAGVLFDPPASLGPDRLDGGIAGEDAVVDPALRGEDQEGEILHRRGLATGSAEDLGHAGDAPRGLVEERGVLDAGGEPVEQLGLEQDELAGVGRQGQARRTGIADPEVADRGVGMRPRLAKLVAPIPGKKGGGEPSLGEPPGVEGGRHRVAITPVPLEPLDDHAEQPLLAEEGARRERGRPPFASLQHRPDPIHDHPTAPPLVSPDPADYRNCRRSAKASRA